MKTLVFAVLLVFTLCLPERAFTLCLPEELTLEDVSCNPPCPGGPDGRTWFHITCGMSRPPIPWDWQLARLTGNIGDVFVWNGNPTYGYIQGEAGVYQLGVVTSMGEINAIVTLPLVSCEDRK